MPWTQDKIGLFGNDLRRLRAGKKTRTGMTEEALVKALHEGVKKGGKKVHHSPLVEAIYKELEGVQMRDTGEAPTMATAPEKKKYYPSLCLEFENVPELKDKGVGDVIAAVVELVIKSIEIGEGNKGSCRVEIQSIGIAKEGKKES